MAFTFNSGGLLSGLGSTDDFVIAYTAGANSKLVVLTLCGFSAGATSRGDVAPTYDGNAMTQVGTAQTSAEGWTEMWYYLSPVAASRNIIVPNTNLYSIRYSASDYTNATADAALFGSGGASNGDAADVPATIASVPDGSVCVSCMVHGEKDEFASITGGTTLLTTPSVDEGATQTGAAYSIQSGTGDETHTYVSGGSSDDYNWVMGAWEEVVADVDINAFDANPTVTDTSLQYINPLIVNTADENPTITDAIALNNYEDFTAYTEVDPGDDIEFTPHSITFTDLDTRKTESYFYRDFGVDYFNGDLVHQFQIEATGFSGISPYCAIWGLANTIDDFQGIDDANGDYQAVLLVNSGGTYYLQLRLCENGVVQLQNTAVSQDVNYFVTIERDNDGGANSTGSLILRICTTAYYGQVGASVVGTANLDCGAGEQNAFQYLYALASFNTGDTSRLLSGSINNLERKYDIDLVGENETISLTDDVIIEIPAAGTIDVNQNDANLTITDATIQYITPYLISTADENPTVTDESTLSIPILLVNVNDSITISEDATVEVGVPWPLPSSLTLTTGAIDSGALTDVYQDNGIELVLTETVGTPGYVYDFSFGEFQDVPDTEMYLFINGYYDGNPAHIVRLQQWNYVDGGGQWDYVTAASNDFPQADSEQNFQFTLLDDPKYISSGVIQLRIVHESAGNPIHLLHIDYMYLTSAAVLYTVNQSDSLTVTDSIDEYLSLYEINAFDSLTLTEDSTVTEIGIGIYSIDTSDDITITESSSVLFDVFLINVNDDIGLTDDYGATITGAAILDIDEPDSVTITDAVSEFLTPLYSREESAAPAADDTDLANYFTVTEYGQVDTDDADRTLQPADVSKYAVYLFKDTHTTEEDFSVEWNGQSSLPPATSTIYLQVYDRVGTTWETLDSNNAAGADTDFTLSGSKTTGLSNYYDSNYTIACRIYQEIT